MATAVALAGCGRTVGGGGESVADARAGRLRPATESLAGTAEAPAGGSLSALAQAKVERFCGDCHPLPAPESFPRDRWPKEVRQGFDFYLASLRTDLPRPPEGDAIRYFQATAPDRLSVPRAADRPESPPPIVFQPVTGLTGADTPDPAVAQVVALPRTGAGTTPLRLLSTDMRSGEIRSWELSGESARGEVVARLAHPCRLTAATPRTVGTDTPAGEDGWFVGDLGSFLPEDHAEGGVFFFPGGPRAGEPVPIRRGLGRVIEAVPFDWDQDGRRDLLVAEFGWRAGGALRMIPGGAEPGAVSGAADVVIDPRHGVLDLRVADLDGDGQDDVVAAFAQEHESVEAWFSRGKGTYDHREIARFPDPSWGSSGIDIADLDSDGDLDILHANGDTMDSGLARPTHGIRALLNDGAAGFRIVEIARMPGVSQVRAADLDGDGDLDVVASAVHPGAAAEPPGTFDAVIWVEQGRGGLWIPHSVERDDCRYAAFTLADADGDGRIDIVAGVWLAESSGVPAPAIRVWLNRAATP